MHDDKACNMRDMGTTGAINWAPTDGDKSRLNLNHTLLMVKRAKYIARFNDIDGIYHVMPILQFIPRGHTVARWVGARFIAPAVTTIHVITHPL